MKLIIGGACQGKLNYAKQVCRTENGWIDGRACTLQELAGCGGIHHFHELVKRLMQGDMDRRAAADEEAVSVQDKDEAPEEEAVSVQDKDEAPEKVPVSVQDKNAVPGEAAVCMQAGSGAKEQKTPQLCGETVCRTEEQAEAFAEWLAACNPDIVIVSNELGYGIVPVEKADRMWREAVGRLCTCLAARSEMVVRVVCGIGMRLK